MSQEAFRGDVDYRYCCHGPENDVKSEKQVGWFESEVRPQPEDQGQQDDNR